MEELVVALKVLMANQTFMYFKTHTYHWNVEGIEFSQYHSFFGDLYIDIYNSVDPTAEQIRALDRFTPLSLSELHHYKTIDENESRIDLIRDMLSTLLVDNNKVIDSLNKVFSLASKENKQGLCNFIADRLDTHNKHGWMIRASLKRVGD
jgi:starvation-inducible DNA-binding protein